MKSIKNRIKLITSLRERLNSQLGQLNKELTSVVREYVKRNHKNGIEVAPSGVNFDLPAEQYCDVLFSSWELFYDDELSKKGTMSVIFYDIRDDSQFRVDVPLTFLDEMEQEKITT